MLYKILWVLMNYGLKFYFRKVEIRGTENIPQNQPVIFACNHPSSFLEPCALACLQPRVLHFLVRGDVFRIKWLKGLLKHTNQIPIFRFKDGYKNLKKNKSSFSRAYEILDNGGAMIIYPEGSTIWAKTLRPLQRGLAKMAFGAFDEKQLTNLKIIPVGFNYFNVLSWRSDLWIEIGKPISIADYLDDYEGDAIKTIRKLTTDTHKYMEPLVVHFKSYKKSHDVLLLDAIVRRSDKSLFNRQKKFSDQNNSIELEDSDDDVTQQEYTYWVSNTSFFSHAFLFCIYLLPGVVGLIFSIPILKIGKWIVEKNKMDVEFYAPVKLGIVISLGLVSMTLCLLVFGSLGYTYLFWISLFIPLWIYFSGLLKSELDYFSGWFNRSDSKSKMESLSNKIENI